MLHLLLNSVLLCFGFGGSFDFISFSPLQTWRVLPCLNGEWGLWFEFYFWFRPNVMRFFDAVLSTSFSKVLCKHYVFYHAWTVNETCDLEKCISTYCDLHCWLGVIYEASNWWCCTLANVPYIVCPTKEFQFTVKDCATQLLITSFFRNGRYWILFFKTFFCV